jgi:nucleoside-diphosphate-sugar epimerase
MKNILVIGAAGQIGSELVPYLRSVYGASNVVASDVHDNCSQELKENGPFEMFSALDGNRMNEIVEKYNIDTIYNLVAMLSAKAEADPKFGWDLNMGVLFNCLEIAREKNIAVFTPSSIGAFGPETPLDNTPQDTIMRPKTIYGVSKVAGEILCDYYFKRFGVDTRGVRYPGIISYVTLPGGGTTDYAVEIYYDAIKKGTYSSNLAAGTYLDMMYMPDAIKAAVDIMEADPAKLVHRNCFNVASMSFDPEIIAKEIKKHIPDFTLTYDVDPMKQAIAESWPNSMDDSAARAEWGWSPKYNLETMTVDMLEKLRIKLK